MTAGTTTRTRARLGGRILLYVPGLDLRHVVAEQLARGDAAGVSLYRHVNDAPPERLRQFTAAIHGAARQGDLTAGPALIAADQEGGQLVGVGTGTTAFPGAMALGAVGDEDLAERVGRATGLELRALGITVDFAPVCDLASNPANPTIGIRSFGSDPDAVGRLAAATVRGLQSAGVAAVVKHFPGLGDTAVDSHFGLPVIEAAVERLDVTDWVPFRAAIEADARMAMSAHIALPAVTGSRTMPATMSRTVMHDILRDRLGFGGVSITDALDMAGAGLAGERGDVLVALEAGVDVLLCGPDVDSSKAIERSLQTASTDRFATSELLESARRIADLRAWLAGFEPPSLDVVGAADHRALAIEVATRSITLVRDDAALLPLAVSTDADVLVIEPRPRDLTPADTSSYCPPGGLAAAIRREHPRADGVVFGQPPTPTEIAAIRERAARADVVILGTIEATRDQAQAELAHQVMRLGRPTVVIALRTPWDLLACPDATTYLCSYGILPPSLDAVAAALWGRAPISGRLPVAIGERYPRGHGLARVSNVR